RHKDDGGNEKAAENDHARRGVVDHALDGHKRRTPQQGDQQQHGDAGDVLACHDSACCACRALPVWPVACCCSCKCGTRFSWRVVWAATVTLSAEATWCARVPATAAECCLPGGHRQTARMHRRRRGSKHVICWCAFGHAQKVQ